MGNLVLRAQDISDRLLTCHQVKVTALDVRKVLNNSEGIRYRKVKWVPAKGNSPQSLVLRQKFAQYLLAQLHTGKRILNVDESWLGVSDFRRMAWQHRDLPTSQGLSKV